MAVKQYYNDIDLVQIGQLINARLQNVNNAEMQTLSENLGEANTGLIVFNTDQNQQFNWNGDRFDAIQIDINGDIVFKGVIDPVTANENTVDVSGYQYVFSATGVMPAVLTYEGRAVEVIGDTNTDGTIDVQQGDLILFVDELSGNIDVDRTQSVRANKAYIFQRNTEYANEVADGTIRIATPQEVLDGVVDNEAVTPATLKKNLDDKSFVKQYFETVTVAALTPTTITHNLRLINQDAFTFNAMVGGSQVSFDVDSIDNNTITITSVVPIPNVLVTVQGAVLP